jgi:hypothetical protein
MLVRTRPVLTRVAFLAAAVGLAIGTAVPASGAATPGWRVVKIFGPAEGVWADNFVATGAGDAWSTWDAVSHSLVERWTGRAWRQVPVPPNLAGDAASSVAIGASSASNAWLFDPGKVLRWNGSAWRLETIPAWVVHINLSGSFSVTSAVFSASSVWVFSAGVDSMTKPDHFAAHYNGHVWVKVQLPGVISQVSALSPTDIWALGVTTATALGSNPAYILMHWNGKTWATVRIPKVSPPAGAVEFPVDLAATGPADAWLQRDIDQGSAGARTLYLLHWNGRSWTRVNLGFPTSFVDYMTQDGHGGVWMVANGPARAFRFLTYHLNAGHWTRYTAPVATGLSLLDLTGISWIPGTRSVWLTGNMTGPPNGNGIFGAILKFGP